MYSNRLFKSSRIGIDSDSGDFYYHFLYKKGATFPWLVDDKAKVLIDHVSFHNNGRVHATFKKNKEIRDLQLHQMDDGLFKSPNPNAVFSPLLHTVHLDQPLAVDHFQSTLDPQKILALPVITSFSILIFIMHENINPENFLISSGFENKLKIMGRFILEGANNKNVIVLFINNVISKEDKDGIKYDNALHSFMIFPKLNEVF